MTFALCDIDSCKLALQKYSYLLTYLLGVQRAKVLGQLSNLSVQLVSKISNLHVCDRNPPTYRRTTCDRNRSPRFAQCIARRHRPTQPNVKQAEGAECIAGAMGRGGSLPPQTLYRNLAMLRTLTDCLMLVFLCHIHAASAITRFSFVLCFCLQLQAYLYFIWLHRFVENVIQHLQLFPFLKLDMNCIG